jgi:hypothetical protein
MSHEKSSDQLVGNGQGRKMQLSPQRENSQGDLEGDQGGSRKSEGPDRDIRADQENCADGESEDGKAGSTRKLAMPQNPSTQFTRRKTLIHSPLAGHGGPNDALGEHQSCTDHGQGKPPGWKGA